MSTATPAGPITLSAYLTKLIGANEKAVFRTRKHVIVIARALLGGIVAAIIIVGGALFVSTATGPIGLILGALVVLPLWQVVTTLVRWQNEEYIVTNRRVIKVEGVVSKHVFDSSLEKINDVELDQSWLGRLLNYGDVEIITGSDIGENKFTHLANPIGFKLALLNQKEALGTVTDFGAREKRVLTSDAPTKGDIPELIAELDELRQKGIISQTEFDVKKAELLMRL